MSHRHGQSPWTMAVVVDSFHWLLCTAEIINILQLEKGIAHSLMCRYIHRHKLYLVNLNLLLSSWGATTLPRTYFRHEFPSTLTFSSITQVCNRGLLYFRHEFPSINSLAFSSIYLLKSTQYSQTFKYQTISYIPETRQTSYHYHVKHKSSQHECTAPRWWITAGVFESTR